MDISTVERNYERAACSISDINEHIPTLRRYAKLCASIVEMGVRGGNSTWGFMQGMVDAALSDPSTCRTLVGYDVMPAPVPYQVDSVQAVPNFVISFRQENVLHTCPVSCDLLFIDTFHVYGQLKRELALHAPGTRKFILMHDTTVDEWVGEAVRSNMNLPLTAEETNMSHAELTMGLWPAIEEFLAANTEWTLRERMTNCNGLTVLERRDITSATKTP